MSATIVTIAGRSLLALLFILAGAAKIAGPQPFLDHMAEHHIPGLLLPLVILLELGAGVVIAAHAFSGAKGSRYRLRYRGRKRVRRQVGEVTSRFRSAI